MDFIEFKKQYLKETVKEYPNSRAGKKPIVTVKLVTYNHANYIKECLDSILMQITDFDFEILIAEDDSYDGTREICIEYADKYPDKIKLFLNSRKNNIFIEGKPSGTFNSIYASFSISSKYVSIIEGDDYWTDKYSLQKRINFLEENEDFVLCYHNSKVYFQQDECFYKDKLLDEFNSKIIERNNILNYDVATATLLYRNNLIDIFEEGMNGILCGDVLLKAKLNYFGKGKLLLNVEDSVYRIHKGGIYSSSHVSLQYRNSLKARHYLLEYFKQKNWDASPIIENLAKVYFIFFIKNLFLNREFSFSLLKKSRYYRMQSKISFLKIHKKNLIKLRNSFRKKLI